MKCTGKRRAGIAVILLAAVLAGGCGTKTYEFEQMYDVYGTKLHYQEQADGAADGGSTQADGHMYFAKDLCVGEDVSVGTDPESAQYAEAAGVFHTKTKQITYAKNIYEKMYPASTTKILTAYIALKYGKLSDVITISAAAADQPADSSVCEVKAGDKLTLEELLYGLIIVSGNDAADAIAEYISGDEDKFAELMNEEAAALGATHSHFVNPHGLQDEGHYTCVYDLYLIFQAALQYDVFKKIIRAKEYTVTYEDANGLSVTQVWPTTNLFLTGEVTQPKGVQVIGGKTGTTNDAGYCLVLYSKRKKAGPIISIVMKADSRESLYQFMGELVLQ